MRFEVIIREEKRRPVIRIGPLVRENGDTLRIERNAAEWHRRYRGFAARANEQSAAALGGKAAYETAGKMLDAEDAKTPVLKGV